MVEANPYEKVAASRDSIDHCILLEQLRKWFGITGIVLDWMSSYITDKFQQMKLEASLSPKMVVPCDVPQGSVFGRLLFTLYTAPLSKFSPLSSN